MRRRDGWVTARRAEGTRVHDLQGVQPAVVQRSPSATCNPGKLRLTTEKRRWELGGKTPPWVFSGRISWRAIRGWPPLGRPPSPLRRLPAPLPPPAAAPRGPFRTPRCRSSRSPVPARSPPQRTAADIHPAGEPPPEALPHCPHGRSGCDGNRALTPPHPAEHALCRARPPATQRPG